MAMPTIRLEMDLQDLGRPQPDAKPEQPSLIPAECASSSSGAEVEGRLMV
jgi:hypothetical protein